MTRGRRRPIPEPPPAALRGCESVSILERTLAASTSRISSTSRHSRLVSIQIARGVADYSTVDGFECSSDELHLLLHLLHVEPSVLLVHQSVLLMCKLQRFQGCLLLLGEQILLICHLPLLPHLLLRELMKLNSNLLF